MGLIKKMIKAREEEKKAELRQKQLKDKELEDILGEAEENIAWMKKFDKELDKQIADRLKTHDKEES